MHSVYTSIESEPGERAGTITPGLQKVLSTQGVPARDRLEWWAHTIGESVMRMALRRHDADGFDGRIEYAGLPGNRVATFTFTPRMTARRGREQIRHHDSESYFLFMTRGGPVQLEQMRNVAHLPPGSLALFDTSHALAAEFLAQAAQPQRITLLELPRATLPLPFAKTDRLLGRPLADRSPAGMLLGHFLSGFTESAAHGGLAELGRVAAIGTDLATAFIAGLIDASDALPPETRGHVLLVRINAFIDRNLGDPELRPAAIAAHHHVSLRTLHQLFRTQPETVGATIRRRRLERCRNDLLNPRLRHLAISDIALRRGYRHPADFSRAFRAAYGIPPSHLRQAALAAPGPRGSPVAVPEPRGAAGSRPTRRWLQP